MRRVESAAADSYTSIVFEGTLEKNTNSELKDRQEILFVNSLYKKSAAAD